MGNLIDLTDRHFGALTVIRREGREHGHPTWLCVCACGAEKLYRSDHLRAGYVTSCGDRKVHPRPRVQVPGYNDAHSRLRRIRGSASAHQCATCDQPAKTWAYLRGSRTEIRTEGNVPYSLNPHDYHALCKKCHALVDVPRKVMK